MKFRDSSPLRCYHNNMDASGTAVDQNLTAFHVSAEYGLVMKGDMNSNIKLCPEYQSNFMRFLAS